MWMNFLGWDLRCVENPGERKDAAGKTGGFLMDFIEILHNRFESKV
jgi:hypothetical protein